MFNTIIEASKNFCTHQINQTSTIVNTPTKERTLIAYIDIETNSGYNHRVYVASDYAFMQRIAKLFLEEDESDEETLMDMTLETANLIIGSAKVLSEATNEPYIIKTPHFEKIDFFDFHFDKCITLDINNSEMTIAIKDLNGI